MPFDTNKYRMGNNSDNCKNTIETKLFIIRHVGSGQMVALIRHSSDLN